MVRFFGGGNVLPPAGWRSQWPLSIITEKPNWRAVRTDQSSYVNTPWFNTAATYTCDAYLSNVVLLLGFEGADASTGAPGMTDESTANNKGLPANVADNAQIDTAQFKFGTSSLLLDGTNDAVRFLQNDDYLLSNGAFTIECWIRPATVAAGTYTIVGQWQAAPDLGWILYQFAGQLWFNCSTNGTNNFSDVGSATLLSANTWYAVAIDFDGTKYRMYLNGTMVASSTTLRTINNSTLRLSIGAYSLTGGNYYNGWIDELRISKGIARYASDGGYTPATAAFPRNSCGTDPYISSVKLLVGANGLNGATTTLDESPAAHGAGSFVGIHASLDTSIHKFGVSSIALSDTFGGAVQWPTSTDWNLGSGNFTIECWVRPSTIAAGFAYIFDRWDTVGSSSYVLFRSANTLRWNTSTTGADSNADITTGVVLAANTWTAVAIDFDGSKYRLYADGVMAGSFSTPRTLFDLTNSISIGGSSAGVPSNTFEGWIDEVRLTKGVARYASDSGYTVPTAEFPRS